MLQKPRQRHGLKNCNSVFATTVLSLVLLLLMSTASAIAATIVVNSLADTRVSDGACTLREATINANNDNQSGSSDCAAGNGADVIAFSVAGTITLSSSLGIGAPLVGSDITIDGANQITISGGNSVRMFVVACNGSPMESEVCKPSGVLTLMNLTIADGMTSSSGGAILNSGQLTVINTTFVNNSAAGSNGGAAIRNSDIGRLTVIDSTFTGNKTPGILFGGAISNELDIAIANSTFVNNEGGAIYNERQGGAAIVNSTFVGNIGGAIVNNSGFLTSVSNSTFFGNIGRAIFNDGVILVSNSIFANNAGSNCLRVLGTLSDNGNNIDDGTSCGFSAANNSKPNTDPLVDPAGLKNNGGRNLTLALCTGGNSPSFGCTGLSPAVDSSTACSSKDQRGFVRPADGDGNGTNSCDIGAFESGALPPPSIFGSPRRVPQGELVNVSWSGIRSPSSKDWIAIYRSGTPNSAYLSWAYANSCQTGAVADLRAAGTCDLFVPFGLADGLYELRLLSNDGFNSLAVSESIVVGGPPLPPPPGVTLVVNPSTVSRGTFATISWNGIENLTTKDWLGLYAPGAANTAHQAWVYTSSCQTTAGALAKASGTCGLFIPTIIAPGNYEIRLLANDGFKLLTNSAAIFVQ